MTTDAAARDVLGAHGYRVLDASSAEDGLALARAERPQLILMDVQLPGIDRLAALRALRAGVPDDADAGHRRDSGRHGGRPGAAARGRLRRLPREAGQHPRASVVLFAPT